MVVCFTPTAWQQYIGWQIEDKKTLKKINELIKEISRENFGGIGKPEALKHDLKGYWSRRITQEHRLVYKIESEQIIIIACKYHY
jgi:toxin YoeB